MTVPAIPGLNASNTGGSVPTTSNGLPDFTSILTAGTTQSSFPVDPGTGMVLLWDLPSGVTSSEANAWWNTRVWFDTGHHPSSVAVPGADERNKTKVQTPASQQILASAADIMKQYAAESQNDPVGFAALQKQLQQAGFFKGASQVYGGWNDQTEQALADALYQYTKVAQGSGVGLNFKQFLANQAISNLAINGNTPGGGSGGSSSPILADTDTLTRYAQMAAQNALGRALTASELSKFVSEFHNQQIQSYTDAANHNGLSAVKDDPRSSAIGFVEQNNPTEFGQHQVQGYSDAFLNMFLPSGSSAPNVSVDPTAIGY